MLLMPKQPVFTSVPVFIKYFFVEKIYKKSIFYCQDQEIACCYHDCKKNNFYSLGYSEHSNDYFDNLKKNLIPYFYDINRHNKGASNV